MFQHLSSSLKNNINSKYSSNSQYNKNSQHSSSYSNFYSNYSNKNSGKNMKSKIETGHGFYKLEHNPLIYSGGHSRNSYTDIRNRRRFW